MTMAKTVDRVQVGWILTEARELESFGAGDAPHSRQRSRSIVLDQ